MRINNQELSKNKVKEIAQTILRFSPLNSWLQNEETLFLNELLKHHPNYLQKCGIGIKGFKIKYTRFGEKGFILYRKDNSFTDFSYLICIQKPTLSSQIKQACRTAVEKDIINFKKREFGGEKIIECNVSNKKLTFNKSHVDHHPISFKDIFEMWIVNKTIMKNDLNPTKDNEETIYFINKKIEKDFRDFHNKIAILRIVSPEINLRKKDDTKTT